MVSAIPEWGSVVWFWWCCWFCCFSGSYNSHKIL
jgi:hypothetical protein